MDGIYAASPLLLNLMPGGAVWVGKHNGGLAHCSCIDDERGADFQVVCCGVRNHAEVPDSEQSGYPWCAPRRVEAVSLVWP
jgi:hypothetical protein